jgi:hypothetical protein
MKARFSDELLFHFARKTNQYAFDKNAHGTLLQLRLSLNTHLVLNVLMPEYVIV